MVIVEAGLPIVASQVREGGVLRDIANGLGRRVAAVLNHERIGMDQPLYKLHDHTIIRLHQRYIVYPTVPAKYC